MAGNRTCVRFSIKCVTHVTQSWVSCVTEMWIPRLSLQRARCCHVRKQMQQQQHSDNAWQLWSVSVAQSITVSSAPTHIAPSRVWSGVEWGVSFQRCQLMREVAEMELMLQLHGVEVWSRCWLRSLYAPLTCKSNSKQVELGTVYTIWGPKTPRTDITKFVVWQKAKQAI